MFNKRKHVLILTFFFCTLFGALLLSLNTPEILNARRNNENDENPKISANNDTIFIDGNNMFADNASSEGWNGNGTYNNPYIIENYEIDASIGHGIEIRNTDLYFIIRNVTVSDGRSNYYFGIYLANVTNGELKNNTADNNIAGFLLMNSHNNTLTGNLATNSLHGFRIWYSNNNTLTNNTANENIEYGIYLDNSNYSTISENILLLNGLGSIFEENCVGNDISDNICGLKPFTLSSDVDGFDEDGSFTLNWTVSENADNYTLYQNGEIIAEGLTITNYNITDLAIGTYVFFVKAINEYEEIDSNTIEVIVSHIIHVDGNADFYQTAVAHNFTGNGTYGNPYIIENYEIVASVGHGIHIQNTDVYFIIRNVGVSNGRSNNYFGFYLANVTNGKLENNTANNNLYGFLLKDTYNVTLEGNTATGNLNGITLSSSNNNTITNNTANDNIEYGIYLDNSNNNTISENILLNNELGCIYEENCVGNDISDNKCGLLPFTLYSDVEDFDSDGTFTLTWTASQNADNYTLYQDGVIIAEGLTILEYTITDLPVGTYVFYVKAIKEYEEKDSNTIEVTVIFSLLVDGNANFNQTAVALNLTGNGTYINPYIIENYEIVASEEHGIHIQNTDVYFIIRNVVVSNGRSNNYFGFYLANVTNGKLENNTANNNLYGFLLKDSHNNSLEGNTAKDNLNGITLNSSNYNILTYNSVTNNRHGLSLDSSYNNSLTGNEVTDNTYLGVYLGSSNNNIIMDNTATGNLNGFSLSSSNNNTITNNTANNNDQHGFRLWYSNNNILTDNIANNNLKYGIYLEESNFNEISGNSLADNGLGSIYEKMSEEMDFPDIFLISAIIVVIAVVSFIIIKATFFIRKKFKLSGFKLSLKKLLRDKNR